MLKNIFFSLIFISLCISKPIIVQYTNENSKQVFKYFNGIQNDFYIDVGAYDPYSLSNTIQHYAAGWDGINIDASPSRIGYFAKMRKDNFNMAVAIGEKNKFITLYQMEQEGHSTTLKHVINKKQTIKNQVVVPSMTLAEVCERYYYKTPAFLSLDIEGFGSQALQGNNWTNPLCRPEVIFSESNILNQRSGLPLPRTILSDKNYTFMELESENQIYIANQVLQKYKQIKQRNSLELNNILFVKKADIQLKLRKALNVQTIFSPDNSIFTNYHYDPQKSEIFLVFSRSNKVLDCNFLKQQSKRYQTNLKNRPILVMNYNPHKSPIIVQTIHYLFQLIKIDQSIQLFNLTIMPKNDTQYSVYIFNHKQAPQLSLSQIQIITTNIQKVDKSNGQGYSNQFLFKILVGIIVLLLMIVLICCVILMKLKKKERQNQVEFEKINEGTQMKM